MMENNNNTGVMDDVDALFDAVAARPDAVMPGVAVEVPAASPALPGPAAAPAHEAVADRQDMFRRIGHLTRALHDSLRQLGYDKKLESAVRTLPDARERLNYIASLTGRAAERVLGAVEAGQALQDGLQRDASGLLVRWSAAKTAA